MDKPYYGTQYEYKIEEIPQGEYNAVMLNNDGREGWQIVHVADMLVETDREITDKADLHRFVHEHQYSVTFMHEMPKRRGEMDV